MHSKVYPYILVHVGGKKSFLASKSSVYVSVSLKYIVLFPFGSAIDLGLILCVV